jgi:carboxypeptidase Taq
MARIIHERSTDPRIDENLNIVKNDASWIAGETERVNIRMWRREYDKKVKIPVDLAGSLAAAAAKGESAWESAVKSGDFKSFLPYLTTLVSLNKQKAAVLGFENNPYDALLDEYEPDATAAKVEKMFLQIKEPLVDLLRKIKESGISPLKNIVSAHYNVDEQRTFCRHIVKTIGYNLNAGRIDEAVHPFTVSMGPGDVRITTRYNPEYFNTGIFGCIHEAGHAMYDQGLEAEHYGTPMGSYVSLGVHESQSRLWENMAGRSRGFWEWAYPMAQKAFEPLKNISIDDFLLSVNSVSPGFIRVEADEITYNLHVLLRFELELALFRDELKVEDLPEAWNFKMQQYLGITPPDVSQGVLQDVHWGAGMFGYFPTYTLGNLYAAQLFDAADRELGSLETQFSRGEFQPLLNWLRTNIHSAGQSLSSDMLIEKATGKSVSPESFINYCQSKYSKLYNLQLF